MDFNVNVLIIHVLLISITGERTAGSLIEPGGTPTSSPDMRTTNASTNASQGIHHILPRLKEGHTVFASPEEGQPISAIPQEHPLFVPLQGGHPRGLQRTLEITILPSDYSTYQPSTEEAIAFLTLTVYVQGRFPSMLNDPTSRLYLKYAKAFEKSLLQLYGSWNGFKDLKINGFFNGSIACNFTVEAKMDFVGQILTNRDIDYGIVNILIDKDYHRFDKTKTTSAMNTELLRFKQNPVTWCEVLRNLCPYDTFCALENQSRFVCIHKCITKNLCSNDGECYVNTNGTVKCRCRESSTFVYKGDTCEEKIFVFFDVKNTAIVGVCTGIVIAGLIVYAIWLGRRTAKTPDTTPSGTSESHGHTSRTQNVYSDGILKNISTSRQRPIQGAGRSIYYIVRTTTRPVTDKPS